MWIRDRKYYYTFEDNKVEDKWGDRDGTISGATFANGKSGKALKIADEQKVTSVSYTHLF